MYPRWIWRAFALPGIGWLIAFFLVAFYAIVATSFGFADDVGDPIPVWNPLNWNVGWFNAVFSELAPGGHEDDGRSPSFRDQPLLEINPAQTLHVHVENQALGGCQI